MPEKGIRSTYSQCPVQIYVCKDSETIGYASGFFYEFDNKSFLITNWHVLSGMSFLLPGNPIDRQIPTHIKVKLSSYEFNGGSEENGVFTTVSQEIQIYENNLPCWFEHPELGQLCDVVALPMERPTHCPEFMHKPANRISSMKIPVEPGSTVFIIGFPRAISVGIGLPIWKSGYIASEPYYDVTIFGEPSEVSGMKNGVKLPAFFIDSLTREGMSGSPVFARYTGLWDKSNPYNNIDFNDPNILSSEDIVLSGQATEFIGCYSGRIGSGEIDGAALGLCWREETIIEVCSGQMLGEHPNAG